jgi:methylmalonyl-CoA mutase N-terminal domain/subunit
LKKIDEMGGALAAIENGFIQREIQDSAYAYQKSIEGHHQVLVGVNDYQIDESVDMEALKVDPAIENGQIERLTKFKKKRDSSHIHELLQTLENTARSEENLIPLMIHCVEQNVTLGEICGVLRRVWGEYQPPVWA